MDFGNLPVGRSTTGRLGPIQSAPAGASEIDSAAILAAQQQLEAVSADLLELAPDARDLSVSTGLRGPESPGGRKLVDFNAAYTADVQKVLPGAQLVGDWGVPEVTALKEVIEVLPDAMATRVQGVEFCLADSADTLFFEAVEAQKREDKAKVEQANLVVKALRRQDARAIGIARAAFDLPMVNGEPGFKLAMLRELAMLMNEKPQKLLEFAKLSGWKQTRHDPEGAVMEPQRDATGFVVGEQVSGSARGAGGAPEGAAGPHAQPAKAGPTATGPLRAGAEGARPGTGGLSGSRPGDAPSPDPRRPGQAPDAGATRPGLPSTFDPNRRPVPGASAARGTAPLSLPPARPGAPDNRSASGPLNTPRSPGSKPLTPGGSQPLSPPGGVNPDTLGNAVLGFASRRETLGAAGTGPLNARTGGLAGKPGNAPQTSGNSGTLPGRGGDSKGPAPQLLEAIDGGGRVKYSDDSTVTYAHGPDAHFLPGAQPPADPREDFAQTFQAFMVTPEALMQSAPEKFLFLNADAKQYNAAEVARLARAAGVDLVQVVTSLLVTGRATQAMIDRMCEFHGVSADKVALLAKDQELLGKGANLETLVERLALDIGANGSASSKLLKLAQGLRDQYHGLASRLPLAREGGGLSAQNGVVSWLVSKAGAALGVNRLERLDAQLADVRAGFTQLPLAVQLRTDPRLALGATWFSLSAQERALLTNPTTLQQLIARASERADNVAYIPQNLTANEKAQLANRTVLDALFDPSSHGSAFRAKLAGLIEAGVKPGAPNPEAALKDLKAKNGERVWNLLSDAQKKYFLDPRNQLELKLALQGPEASAARGVLRDGTMGAEQLKAALLRFQFGEARSATDLKPQLDTMLKSVADTRKQLLAGLGGSPLEVALTEVNRQVQEGNMPFVQRFLAARGDQGLAAALGPWVADALTPAERKLLTDPDYRRHLVQDAGQLRSTGTSLAEEAKQFRVQTDTLQQALDFLLRPDNLFRAEFEQDPMAALKRHGLWLQLPDAVQAQLADSGRKVKLAKLVEAVQESLTPIVLRQLGYQKKVDNLKRAIRGVNASNYGRLLGLLDLAEPELQRAVRNGLAEAMAGEAEPKAGGPLTFV